MFIRFDTTHEHDRQTPHDYIGRADASHRAEKTVTNIIFCLSIKIVYNMQSSV